MSNQRKILDLIKENGQQSVKQIAERLGISLQMTHRHLRCLLDEEKIKKNGSAPRVFYTLARNDSLPEVSLNAKSEEVIEQNFLYISPQGERWEGVEGFSLWCQRRGFEVKKKAREYTKLHQRYQSLKVDGLVSGKRRLKEVFGDKMCLEDVFYVDFYAWEIFGKTKLGQLLLFAKQSQDKKLVREVIEQIKPHVGRIIRNKRIDAIGFIPPTVKRQVQFMKIFQGLLKIELPEIEIVKIRTEIITPQKTLNKLEDRIENADSTMAVTEAGSHGNVLLIDDAVGSGATLNQVACKLLRTGKAKKVYGFGITGSLKGFDVISEV